MIVRTWQVEGDTLQVINDKEQEMPMEMVDSLYPDFHSLDFYGQLACSVEVHSTLHGGYIFDPANMKNGIIMYQFSQEEDVKGRSVGKWEWVSFPAALKCTLMEKALVGCSTVSLHEVARLFP